MSDIDYSWISPPASPGMQVVLPPISETNVSRNFSLADQFETIKIESGLIDLEITNYFPSPVRVTLRNLVLKNAGSEKSLHKYQHRLKFFRSKQLK